MTNEYDDKGSDSFLGSCPVPLQGGSLIQLAHGEGTRLTRQLLRDVFMSELHNEYLDALDDSVILPSLDGRPVMTTDSYVVSPLFFPGGDIGRLAVYGTVNDLAVCGADPLYITLAVILEEGLPIDTLRRVVASIKAASAECGVQIVAGDTKVVPRGMADRMFVNTTGLGSLRKGIDLGAHRICPGDQILISGTLADHGIAILGSREGFDFGTQVESDAAPLHGLVRAILDSGADVHWMRDPTRGGVAAALHECAESSRLSILIDESALPLNETVRGVCELLGLDPLHVANEGKLLAIVAREDAARALETMRIHPLGRSAQVIGTVLDDTSHHVLVRGILGITRILDEPSGAPLPRIC